MVDKNLNLAIIISATPLNRTGKEPGTGTLSQPFANQTKLYFGLRITRLITGLFKGVATANSNRSDWAGNFFISKNGTSQERTAIQSPALTLVPPRKVTVAHKNIPSSGDFNNSPTPQDLTHLSEADLSALLDLITSQIEFHRDELTRLKPILHRLEGNIPNQPFREFISSLKLGESE